jgi:hypothetical protein
VPSPCLAPPDAHRESNVSTHPTLIQQFRQALRRDKTLPPHLKATLWGIAAFANKSGYAHLKMTTIATSVGVSERQTRSNVRACEATEWLEVVRSHGGRGLPSDYYLRLPRNPEVSGAETRKSEGLNPEAHFRETGLNPEAHFRPIQEVEDEDVGQSNAFTEVDGSLGVAVTQPDVDSDPSTDGSHPSQGVPTQSVEPTSLLELLEWNEAERDLYAEYPDDAEARDYVKWHEEQIAEILAVLNPEV